MQCLMKHARPSQLFCKHRCDKQRCSKVPPMRCLRAHARAQPGSTPQPVLARKKKLQAMPRQAALPNEAPVLRSARVHMHSQGVLPSWPAGASAED